MNSFLDQYAHILRADLMSFVHRSFNLLNPQTPFLSNWHQEVIVSALEQCRQGEIRRLIINLPPRSLKSHMASIAFPAWLLGHNSSAKVVCISYAQDLANRLGMDCRSLMESAFYKTLFPGTAINRNRIDLITTTGYGERMATSVGGVLTGLGGDFLIVDDPLKPAEAISDVSRNAVNDWFKSTLRSRLNNQNNGCVIVIMQRLHRDDLAGYLMEMEGWTVINLPAIAMEDETHHIITPLGERWHTRRAGEALHPERESLEMLAEARAVMGEYLFSAQMQQQPVPMGGGLIKTHWPQFYAPHELPEEGQIIQSWDTANKAGELNDYSVGLTLRLGKDQKIYVLDVLRRRLEFPQLKRQILESAQRFKADIVLIEDKSSGTPLIQELKQTGLHQVKGVKANIDKIARMQAASIRFENGQVFLPKEAPWLVEYLAELTSFPKGKFDDQVDATSQALNYIRDTLCSGSLGLYEFYRELAAGRLG